MVRRADLDSGACRLPIADPAQVVWTRPEPVRRGLTRRYPGELDAPGRAEALLHLRELMQRRRLTLLTATRRIEISEAAVLADLLEAE